MEESKPLVVKPEIPVKRGRGRPFGSKNKSLLMQEKDFFLRPHGRPTQDIIPEKRGPGRPSERLEQDGAIPEKRGPGRPPGGLVHDGVIPENREMGRPPEKLDQDGLIQEKRGPGRPPERLSKDGMVLEKRPPERPKQDRVIMGKRGPGRPPMRPKQGGFILEKRGPGRPPLNRPHISHVRKGLLATKKPSTPMLGPDDQKRGRGRPRKSVSADVGIMKAEKREIKKNSLTPITGGDKKKNKLGRDRKFILTSKSNVMMSMINPSELPTVKVVVGGKPRGRPRKIKPNEAQNEQASFCHPELWNTPVKYEQPHLHSPSEFHPYGPGYPTEMRFISSETGLLQSPQEVTTHAVDPHSPWENREVIDEDDSSQEIQEHRYPSWESQPAAQWMHSAAEYGGNALDNGQVSQWVMGRPAASREPPSPYPPEPHPEQPNYQEGLISELSDFKCQLLKELAATRAEIREGAQLMRSAIAGVSTEISRLGQMLQPLVSAITAANSSRQDRPMAFVPRFQQDTPPDDILDIFQTSTQVRSPAPSTGSDDPTTEAGSVKLEDNMDAPQVCAYQVGSPQADDTTDFPLQKKSGHSKATSSAVSSPQGSPTSARSLPSSPSIICVDQALQENVHSPSLIISEAS